MKQTLIVAMLALTSLSCSPKPKIQTIELVTVTAGDYVEVWSDSGAQLPVEKYCVKWVQNCGRWDEKETKCSPRKVTRLPSGAVSIDPAPPTQETCGFRVYLEGK